MSSREDQDSPLADEFSRAICHELDDAVGKIRHCVNQLSEDQMWWRRDEATNSIANLILHLSGNLRQWIIAGVGGAPDLRNRPQEFAQRDRIPTDHLMRMLDEVAADVKRTVQAASVDDLMRQRTIQGFKLSGLQAVLDSVAHFRGHTQEIIHITRIQLADKYEFDFVPGPDQQGGAAQQDDA